MAKSGEKPNSVFDLIGRIVDFREPKPKDDDPGLCTVSVMQTGDKSCIDFYLRGDNELIPQARKFKGEMVVISGHIKAKAKTGKGDYVQYSLSLVVSAISPFDPKNPPF